MIVETNISYGFESLIAMFFRANELDVKIHDMRAYPFGKIILEFEDNSDTALSITQLSYRHLGFENMLCDYLNRCGISPGQIAKGKYMEQRDMKELDKQWEEHRKHLGFDI